MPDVEIVKRTRAPYVRGNVVERFLSKESRGSLHECWIWQAALTDCGYGTLFGEDRRPVSAHRLSYTLRKGPIPDGMVILHTCDTPACTNPAHLRAGTQQDNIADMVSKGRLVNPIAAANRAKTHCPKGHEYTPDNCVKSKPVGHRDCRECNRLRMARNRMVNHA